MLRWRPRWQSEGQEPDYRFTLANERTFLAWIRTALAVLAAAVVARQFASELALGAVRDILVASLVVLGGLMAGTAYLRWRSHEIAMRHGEPLASAGAVAIVTVVVLCITAGSMALLFKR